MATSKRKPSPAQLAARAAFAAKARAGTLKRKTKPKTKPTAKRAGPPKAKRAPHKGKSLLANACVYTASGRLVASCPSREKALEVAQALADATGKPHGIK